MSLTKLFIESVISGAVVSENFISLADPVVCHDSRMISAGALFVALSGARIDGHTFIGDAVNNGASAVMISHNKKSMLAQLSTEQQKKTGIIMVPDTYTALLQLAAAWRAQFSYPVIGITGSIGKTSTKELLASIVRLSGKKYIVSSGNQNTALGVALTILRMRSEHEVAIFEMGISKRGEMARMAQLARPTTAAITAIGHSHMEGLGSLADIAAEKRDIFSFFGEDNIGVVNGDQPIISGISYKHPILRFGLRMTNQLQARKIQTHGMQTECTLKIYNERYDIALPTNHAGRVMQALAAASLARVIGIPSSTIIKGIQEPIIVNGRFEQYRIKKSSGIMIHDAYNASPESMKAALIAFDKMDSFGQKIAVIGDMLELGVTSAFWHRQIGRLLRKVPSLQHLILVGEQVKWTRKTVPLGLSCEIVPTWQEAVKILEQKLDQESLVLVKASNGMGLGNLVDVLAEKEII